MDEDQFKQLRDALNWIFYALVMLIFITCNK